MGDDAIRGEGSGNFSKRDVLRFIHQLRRVLLVKPALRLQAKVMQISDAVDNLRPKILTYRLEAARRGFDAVQINQIE